MQEKTNVAPHNDGIKILNAYVNLLSDRVNELQIHWNGAKAVQLMKLKPL